MGWWERKDGGRTTSERDSRDTAHPVCTQGCLSGSLAVSPADSRAGGALRWASLEELWAVSHRAAHGDVFISVYLASVGPAGWACSGVGPRSWGHSAWGGGCGRELSRRGGGLPQAWAGSLGEGHRIHVALEPLFCTQRLAGPSSGTAGVLFCPEAQSSDNCPRHLGQNVSIGDGAGKWVALQVQPHRQGTICSMQGMKDRHKLCRPTRLNSLVHFPFSEAWSGK